MKSNRWVLIGIALLTAAIRAESAILQRRHNNQQSPTPSVSTTIPRPPAREIAQPHLDWAKQETDRIVDEHVRALDEFFESSKKGTAAFAEDALGWKSKLNLAIDLVPYTQGGKHEKYIRERFELHVFSPSNLEAEVKRIVDAYLQEVKSIESKMLVNIRADARDFPTAFPIASLDEEEVGKRFDEAITAAVDAAEFDAATAASREVASLIAGEVLAYVAVRLGTSAGILATGSATSLQTLGIGFFIGVIVDVIISWIWDWWADPKGELAGTVNSRLDDIQTFIVDGVQDRRNSGLRNQLIDFSKRRAEAREAAVLHVLEEN